MTTELIRRTFNINNFESLTIEGEGTDENPERARILAAINQLTKVQPEMLRIFHARAQMGTAHEYDGLVYNLTEIELANLKLELENLRN